MREGEKMSLEAALEMLVEVHTRDDDLVGYQVMMGAQPRTWHNRGRYLEAWEVARRHIGRQVNPSPTPSDP